MKAIVAVHYPIGAAGNPLVVGVGGTESEAWSDAYNTVVNAQIDGCGCGTWEELRNTGEAHHLYAVECTEAYQDSAAHAGWRRIYPGIFPDGNNPSPLDVMVVRSVGPPYLGLWVIDRPGDALTEMLEEGRSNTEQDTPRAGYRAPAASDSVSG